jgi:hypothetical protein
MGAKTGKGNPPYKASNGGLISISNLLSGSFGKQGSAS